MTPYFTPIERIEHLEAVARRWLGTPFRPNSSVCGGGVACHLLAAEILFETGALQRFAVPLGSARKLLSEGVPGAMVAYIDANLSDRMIAIDASCEPMAGDFVAIKEKESRIAIHVGIVLSGGRFIHVLRHDGVQISMLADTTYQIDAIRRAME